MMATYVSSTVVDPIIPITMSRGKYYGCLFINEQTGTEQVNDLSKIK